MVSAACPDCKKTIDLPSVVQLGQKYICKFCLTALEVVWLYPLTLDFDEDQLNNKVNVGENLISRTLQDHESGEEYSN